MASQIELEETIDCNVKTESKVKSKEEKEKELINKLQMKNTIIRINDKIHICENSIYDSIYFIDYYKYKLGKDNNNNTFIINFVDKTINLGRTKEEQKLEYINLIKNVKIIEPTDVHKEFLDCLKSIHCSNKFEITEEDKISREKFHVDMLNNILSCTFKNIAGHMYKQAIFNNKIIIKFCEETTHDEITRYEKYPPYLSYPNVDGIIRNKKEYIYYILNKAINNNQHCEIDNKVYLSHLVGLKIKEAYPTLNIKELETGSFLHDILISFEIDDILM